MCFQAGGRSGRDVESASKNARHLRTRPGIIRTLFLATAAIRDASRLCDSEPVNRFALPPQSGLQSSRRRARAGPDTRRVLSVVVSRREVDVRTGVRLRARLAARLDFLHVEKTRPQLCLVSQCGVSRSPTLASTDMKGHSHARPTGFIDFSGDVIRKTQRADA